jgi:hypothetical protein
MTSLRRIVFIVGLFFAGGAAWLVSDASAHVSADVYISFRADLAPYGEWFEYGDYGWVWRPRHVHHGWRPYVDGHWALTDVGWTWVADEPWGWAPYHYGRWFDDAGYGWVWVPGDEWAPAWVSWQSGGGYIGWAPLPPWASWSPGVGIAATVYLAPSAYVFVPDHNFVARDVRRFVMPVDRNEIVIRNTRNVTNYTRTGDRIVDRSLDPHEVERVVGHRIASQRVDRLHAAAPRVLRPPNQREQARASAAQHEQARRQERRATARPQGRTTARTAERREGTSPEARHAERPTPRHAAPTATRGRREHAGHAAARPAPGRNGRTAAGQPRQERDRTAKREAVRAHEHATPRVRSAERAKASLRHGPSRPERTTRAVPEQRSRDVTRAHSASQRVSNRVASPHREPGQVENRRAAPMAHVSQRTRREHDGRPHS